MPATPVILCDFQDFFLSQPIGQDKLNHYFAYMMTAAYCKKKSIQKAHEVDNIHRQMNIRMEKYAVSPDQVRSRQYNFLPFINPHDFPLSLVDSEMIHYNKEDYSIDKRLPFFADCAIKGMENFYKSEEDLPDTIVHTTSTGYLAPSPPQVFLSKKNWLTTQVVHAYHMGCYGSIPSVDIAVGLVSASYNSLAKPKRKVDVYHTEISSLHINPGDLTPGNIVNTSLFGDGFIKYSVLTQEEFKKKNTRGLKVVAADTVLLKNSLTEITLTPGPFHFDMYLSKNVPLLIGENIRDFLSILCGQINIDFDKDKNKLFYAIHPGGPKILSHIQQALGLEENKMDYSMGVLSGLGNMVSATLPHVWRDIINADEIKPGDKVISATFGPGLTAIGIIFEKV